MKIPATPEDDDEQLAAVVATLPEALRTKLHAAVVRGAFDELQELVMTVETDHPRLAARVKQLMQAFDLKAMHRLLRPAVKFQLGRSAL